MKTRIGAGLAVLLGMSLIAVPTGDARAQEAGAERAERAAEASWIHVRVDEGEGDGARINLPLSMAEVALESFAKEALDEAHADLGEHGDLTLQDIRRMWAELREAGDGQYVEVRDGDEHIRAYRENDRIHVQVDEGDEETVRIVAPVALVDALLGGEGEELDLMAAVRELARSGSSELVRVRDGDTTVRVWIDDRNSQSG